MAGRWMRCAPRNPVRSRPGAPVADMDGDDGSACGTAPRMTRSAILLRLLRWGILVVGLLLLGLVLLWTLSRVRGPTSLQEAAVAAALRPVAVAPGANAFPAFFLVASSHPDRDDMPEALAAIARSRVDQQRVPGAPSRVMADGPDLALMPTPGDRDRICMPGGESCLRHVRGDLAGYRQLVARHAPLIDRIVDLGRYAHYVEPARGALPTGLRPPVLELALLPMTRHAVRFADGDVDAALAGVCADIVTWRRFASQTDSIDVAIRAADVASRANGKLFADMLREWPAGRSLPAACARAVAPASAAELSRCAPVRGQFAAIAEAASATGDDGRSMLRRAAGNLVMDPDMLVAEMADVPAAACSEVVRTRTRQDRPIDASAVPRLGDALTCVSNASGCIAAGLVRMLHVELFRSAQDHGARLRVLAMLVKLHGSPDDARPIGLRLLDPSIVPPGAGRRIWTSNKGRALCISQYMDMQGAVWSVPVPRAATLAAASEQGVPAWRLRRRQPTADRAAADPAGDPLRQTSSSDDIRRR